MQTPTHAVSFPVFSYWVALNTLAERVLSHGTAFFDQRFGYDLVRLSAAGTLRLPPRLFQQFDQRMQHPVHRRRNTQHLPTPQHVAVQMVNLAAFAACQVLRGG